MVQNGVLWLIHVFVVNANLKQKTCFSTILGEFDGNYFLLSNFSISLFVVSDQTSSYFKSEGFLALFLLIFTLFVFYRLDSWAMGWVTLSIYVIRIKFCAVFFTF